MGIASFSGEARAKFLLFGEHAAVYGYPAVGCALPWELRADHQPGLGWELPGLDDHEPEVQILLQRLDRMAREEGLIPPRPGKLQITTTIPLGSGFGSSGALCAALVNLFWGDLPLTDRDRLAWRAEGQFHGTPSGIDTALSLRRGWWCLDASTRPVTASPLPDPGLVLVVGALVRESNTKSLVGGLARRRAEGEVLVVSAIEALGEISAQASTELAAGRSSAVPGLVRRARTSLQTLGLETPALTAVLDAGLACPGALAGKLSGAGGGGAFGLLFQDQASATKALPTIRSAVEHSLWTTLPQLVDIPQNGINFFASET